MIFPQTMRWYLSHIGSYTLEMLPCICISLLLFCAIRPHCHRKLEQRGLVSPRRREAALLIFILFLSGLAALTLFPANFWPYAVNYFVSDTPPSHFEWNKFYPAFTGWNDLNLQLELFREIKRAFKGPWVFFIMLGNIGIFAPIGFFTALLWRKPRWWRSVLAGFGCSCFIEIVQPFIGRCGDVDDILLNTAGSLLGYVLYRLLHLVCGSYLNHFQCCTKGEHA